MNFPKHKAGLILSHNEHKNIYQSVQEYLDSLDMSIEEERYNAMIRADEIWELQWYPDTPVGFCRVVASTLEQVLKLANEDFTDDDSNNAPINDFDSIRELEGE